MILDPARHVFVVQDILDCTDFQTKSRATLRRRIAAGSFPGPTRELGRKKLWSRGVLLSWLDGTWQPSPAPQAGA